MTEDRSLASVVENVQPDHPGIQIFVAHFRTPLCHYRFSTTKTDTTTSSSGTSTKRLPESQLGKLFEVAALRVAFRACFKLSTVSDRSSSSGCDRWAGG